MMKILLHRSNKPLAWSDVAEYMAREDNRLFDLQKSIRDRTMTKQSYRNTTHFLREFLWRLEQRKLNLKPLVYAIDP